MKLKILLVTIFIIVACSIKAQTRKYTISGKVINFVTNKPISGVYITTGKFGSQTDKNGFFSIKGLSSGNINLTTMYYSSFPKITKQFFLSSDTIVNFQLKEEFLKLDEVVITGTRTERRLSLTPILTKLITASEIRKSGNISVLECLKDNIPGIVSSQNSMGNNLRIRGLNSKYLLFLVDGERMVSEGVDGNLNLDQIDLNNIERVEVLNGAASALYGSNAVGGVINFISKETEHKLQIGAKTLFASNKTWNNRLEFGSNLTKFSSKLSIFKNSSDGFGENGDGPYAARYKDLGGNLNLAYKFNKQFSISMNGRFYSHETFNPSESMNVSHPLSKKYNLNIISLYTSKSKQSSYRLSMSLDKYKDYDIMEKKNDAKEKDDTADYLSLRFVNSLKIQDNWELVHGVEYNRQARYASETLGEDGNSKDIDDYNYFIQTDYELFNKFNIVAGARYTYNSEFKSAFNPKLSLMYSISDFKFRGGIARSYRSPDIKELYYNYNHQGMFWVYGNTNLKAEQGQYASFSVEYTHRYFNISVSAYYNNIDDKISQYQIINTSEGLEYHYKNVSSATLKGIDIDLSHIFFNQLVLKASYSYSDAKDNSTGLQLSENVKNSETLSLTWNGKVLKNPFSLKFSGYMNSPILFEEMNVDSDGTISVDKSKSSSYSVWKTVFVMPIRLQKHNVELSLKCNNLFNFKDTSFINSGREYMVGLRYSFK